MTNLLDPNVDSRLDSTRIILTGQYAPVSDPDRLRRMADEHLHESFPDSVPKDDIGEVFSAMIDADIYGCALRRLDGTLTETDVDWLRDAAERLARSLPLFPSDGQPYFQRVLNLAHETLKD